MRLNDAHELAYELVHEFLPGSDWDVTFDRARHRAAMTNYQAGLIHLSTHFVRVYSRHEVEQVMLHEIGHVLAGPDAGHGREWRRQARSIGYDGGVTVADLKKPANPPWKVSLTAMALSHGVGAIAGSMVGWALIALVVMISVTTLWKLEGPVPKKYTVPEKRRKALRQRKKMLK